MSAIIAFALLLAAAANIAHAQFIVSATNESPNNLQVWDTTGDLVLTLPTGGNGGASGNAGGIAVWKDYLAVVNYGSNSVSLFVKTSNSTGISWTQTITTAAGPVSVAWGPHQLYVLSAAYVESFPFRHGTLSTSPSGYVGLAVGDGSAAQVGYVGADASTGTPAQLIITEKSNVISFVSLTMNGEHIPSGAPGTKTTSIGASDLNVPLGLATLGNNAYVTNAHNDQILLVRDATVLTTTSSCPSVTTCFTGTCENAPCWATIANNVFLFTANSPSHSISRYAIYGQQIVVDASDAYDWDATSSVPTDIDTKYGLLAVITNTGGTVGTVNVFSVDQDGILTFLWAQATANAPNNGVAVF